MNTMNMMDVGDLWFSYGKKPILSGASFFVEEGTLCGLFGPNGSGKTTLFKCCLKFLAYARGTVCMDGTDISGLSVSQMARLVSYVPQDHAPPFPFLVKEIVLMGRSPHLRGVFGASSEDKRKVCDVLDSMGLLDIADSPYNQLSGGQRQLVLMARAIAQETPLMFLDEPTAALDFSNQLKVWKLVRSIVDDGVTVLACSHDPNHVSWFCDKVVVMGSNKILDSGPPEDVITDATLGTLYAEPCVRSYSGSVPVIIPRFSPGQIPSFPWGACP